MDYNRMIIREAAAGFEVFEMKPSHTYAGSVSGGGNRMNTFAASKSRIGFRKCWPLRPNESACRGLWEDTDHRVLRELENGGDCPKHAAFDSIWSGGGSDQMWQFKALFDYDFTRYTSRFT